MTWRTSSAKIHTALVVALLCASVGIITPHTARAYDVIYDSGAPTTTISPVTATAGYYVDSFQTATTTYTIYAISENDVTLTSGSGAGAYLSVSGGSGWPGSLTLGAGCAASQTNDITTPGSYVFVFATPCVVTIAPLTAGNPYLVVQWLGFSGILSLGAVSITQPAVTDTPTITIYGANYPGGNTNTRIDGVVPAPDSTVATSTSMSFGVTGFVNENDFSSSTVVSMTVANLGDISLGGGFSQTFNFPITSSGYFTFSTTTSITESGIYQILTTINAPKYSILGFSLPWFYNIYATLTTQFTAATSTAAQQQSALQYLRVANNSQVLQASTTQNLTSTGCNNTLDLFNSSTTVACLSALFVPSGSGLTATELAYMQHIITTKPPLGYFGLAEQELSLATTTTASTTLEGMDVVAGAFSVLRTGLAIVLWFILLMWLFHRLRHFDFHA